MRPTLAVLLLCACGGGPEEPPSVPAMTARAEGLSARAVVRVEEGEVWLLVADEAEGRLVEIVDLADTGRELPIDFGALDAAWFADAWLLVGAREEEAAFERLSADGEILDEASAFEGSYTRLDVDAERAVFGGVDQGQAFALTVDRTGRFTEVWEDLEGVRTADVARASDAAVLATIEADGTTALLRRSDEADVRAQLDFTAETLSVLPDGRTFVAGASLPPRVRPASAWLSDDFRVEDPTRFEGGDPGSIVRSAVVRGRLHGVEQDVIVLASREGSGAGARTTLSAPEAWPEWTVVLEGVSETVVDLADAGDGRVIAVGQSAGQAAWWVVELP